MPPKIKITADAILAVALEITRRSGIEGFKRPRDCQNSGLFDPTGLSDFFRIWTI